MQVQRDPHGLARVGARLAEAERELGDLEREQTEQVERRRQASDQGRDRRAKLQVRVNDEARSERARKRAREELEQFDAEITERPRPRTLAEQQRERRARQEERAAEFVRVMWDRG